MRIVFWVSEDKDHLPTSVSLTPQEAIKRHKKDLRVSKQFEDDESILQDFIYLKQAKVE